MTLQNKITRRQISFRIMNYDSPPTQYNLYILIPSHRSYETVIELSGYQRKEGGTKCQILVQLNASRMKKNDPTLPTRNTLKTRLFQFKEPTASRAYQQYTFKFETRKKDPSILNAFQKQNFKLLVDPIKQSISCFEQNEKTDKRVNSTESLLL